MKLSLPAPPQLPGYVWRALRRDDALALYQLQLDCAPLDGYTNPSTLAAYQHRIASAGGRISTDTLCAANDAGGLVATAWISFDSRLKGFLLSWMKARARQFFATLADDRPRVLRADFYDRGEDAVALLEQHGFLFIFAEEEMARDLGQPIPANPLPAGMTFVTWTAQRAGSFFKVYDDAFSTRPGAPGWTEEIWRHNLTDDSDFKSDLSLLILDGAEPVGFAICHVETPENDQPRGEGWIIQMGVRPAWRHRGLAGALLSEIMRRFVSEELTVAMLDVNVNNPQAARVYRRLGFERSKRYTSFQKWSGTQLPGNLKFPGS
jgi:ribosomal protein S18 acetylase RimI-like enzyme